VQFIWPSSRADLGLGSENACCGTQKSHGKKMVRLQSDNMTSQLMVLLLVILHALYPLQINSFMQWLTLVNYQLFGRNCGNWYLLYPIVVICKTKQSQSMSDHFDYWSLVCFLAIKSLLSAPSLCMLCPSPIQWPSSLSSSQAAHNPFSQTAYHKSLADF